VLIWLHRVSSPVLLSVLLLAGLELGMMGYYCHWQILPLPRWPCYPTRWYSVMKMRFPEYPVGYPIVRTHLGSLAVSTGMIEYRVHDQDPIANSRHTHTHTHTQRERERERDVHKLVQVQCRYCMSDIITYQNIKPQPNVMLTYLR
jgi:hypothetical protein